MDCVVNGQAVECPGFLTGAGVGFMVAWILIWVIVIVLNIVGLWKVFKKAGKPGWASIIPIYNAIVMLDIAKRPLWWVILLLIPLVNIIFAIILMIDFAKAFGKGTGFGLGLAFLGFIFIPILGFGKAQYVGGDANPPQVPVSPQIV